MNEKKRENMEEKKMKEKSRKIELWMKFMYKLVDSAQNECKTFSKHFENLRILF